VGSAAPAPWRRHQQDARAEIQQIHRARHADALIEPRELREDQPETEYRQRGPERMRRGDACRRKEARAAARECVRRDGQHVRTGACAGEQHDAGNGGELRQKILGDVGGVADGERG